MMNTTVSTKYQIVIPKRIRQKLEIAPGMKLHIEVIDKESAVLHIKKLTL